MSLSYERTREKRANNEGMKRGEELEKNEDRETKRWKQAQQISREMRFGRKRTRR